MVGNGCIKHKTEVYRNFTGCKKCTGGVLFPTQRLMHSSDRHRDTLCRFDWPGNPPIRNVHQEWRVLVSVDLIVGPLSVSNDEVTGIPRDYQTTQVHLRCTQDLWESYTNFRMDWEWGLGPLVSLTFLGTHQYTEESEWRVSFGMWVIGSLWSLFWNSLPREVLSKTARSEWFVCSFFVFEHTLDRGDEIYTLHTRTFTRIDICDQ